MLLLQLHYTSDELREKIKKGEATERWLRMNNDSSLLMVQGNSTGAISSSLPDTEKREKERERQLNVSSIY